MELKNGKPGYAAVRNSKLANRVMRILLVSVRED